MLYKLGRFLQLLGLIIVPLAVSGNVSNSLDLKDSLFFSAVGVLVFFVGWLLQQGAKPPE